MISFPSKKIKSRQAFTMVELISVIAIVALLAVLSMPAIRSFGNAESLSAEAAVVSNLLTLARTQAISLRTPVQVRIATDSWAVNGGANDYSSCYRKMSIWWLDQSNPAATPTWKQLTAWQSIGPSISLETIADPTTSSEYKFTAADTPSSSGGYTNVLSSAYYNQTLALSENTHPQFSAAPAVNTTTADMVAVEFLPTGAVNTGSSFFNLYLMLTEGQYNGASLAYTQKQTPLQDWAQIRITSLTGEISVVRP